MTDLTEQWKARELIEGFYYVKCPWSDEIEVRYVHNGTDEYERIVAPVPSYQELQDLNDRVKLLESALKYSNSTVKWVLPLIKIVCDARIVSEIEEMLSKTNEALR